MTLFDIEEERCADPIDDASKNELRWNQLRVDAARLRAAPEQVRGPDGAWPTTECLDCGEDLEPYRLDLGKVLCFACQTHKEKTEARRGR